MRPRDLPPSKVSGRLGLFVRQLLRVRVGWYGRGQFSALVTHWFYFTNHRYPGERRYFVRVGQRRWNFG